jgi:hypothetical protein
MAIRSELMAEMRVSGNREFARVAGLRVLFELSVCKL